MGKEAEPLIIKKITPIVTATLFGTLACGFALAQTQLDKVLAQMDKTSAAYKNFTANVQIDVYLKVIHAVSEVQHGTVYFEHNNGSVKTATVLSTDGATAKPKIIEYANGSGRMYNPTPNELTIFKSGENPAQAALGLGSSGKDLARYWNITDQGTETVDGKSAEKLDLTPKDPKQLQSLTHVTVWIDLSQGISLKQIFYVPSGDNRTVTYTKPNLQNAPIEKKPYEIRTNKETKVISAN